MVPGLQQGRSYVSDGYAHALDFRVAGIAPGFGKVSLSQTETVRIKASVAFAPATPQTVAQGLLTPPGGKRFLGDTVTFHGPPPEAVELGGTRTVELIVNGNAVRRWIIPADGAIHDLETDLSVDQSSWVALRQFPQLHTNPVEVILEGKPIRVSKRSAQWCAETIKQLWAREGIPSMSRNRNRHRKLLTGLLRYTGNRQGQSVRLAHWPMLASSALRRKRLPCPPSQGALARIPLTVP